MTTSTEMSPGQVLATLASKTNDEMRTQREKVNSYKQILGDEVVKSPNGDHSGSIESVKREEAKLQGMERIFSLINETRRDL